MWAAAHSVTSQQLSGTIGAARAPAMLAAAPADGIVRYGDTVMLSAALGGVLALDTIVRMELPQEAYSVTRTQPAAAVACTRTAWTVTPPAGHAVPEDGVLRIGTSFCLEAVGGAGNNLYLQSQRYTLHNQNYSASAGKRKQGCCVVPSGSADTLWQVRVLDPSDLRQMEAEGAPVAACVSCRSAGGGLALRGQRIGREPCCCRRSPALSTSPPVNEGRPATIRTRRPALLTRRDRQ